LVDRDTVEIACVQHPDPASGDPRTDAVITTTGCLAALGVSAYVGLAAQQIQGVRVRLDACAQCSLAQLQPEIAATIQQAGALLAALDSPQTVVTADPVEHPRKRPVYSVKNPPVSRRGLFQVLGQGTQGFMPALEGETERTRLIGALRWLAPDDLDEPMPGDDFTMMTISDDCNACPTCARACPTEALGFAWNEEQFEITFAAAACVNCGLCLNYGEPQALQRAGAPSVAEVVGTHDRLLHRGALTRCRRCNSRFAGKPDDKLCPVCSFRLKHPFSARTNPRPAARPIQKDI
jgi:ferredoxin